MAKKKKSKVVRKRRPRRTPEQVIADLQAEIKRVRSRQAAREIKQSPSHKAALAAVKTIDKALGVAAEEDENILRHCLAEARKPLSKYLESKGVQLPKVDLPKGPKPKVLKD